MNLKQSQVIKHSNSLYIDVVGNPIDHSLSPRVYAEISKLLNLEIICHKHKLDTEENSFEDFIQKKFKQNLNKKFLNALCVTAPFKQRAFKFSSTQDKTAILAQSANLLVFNKNKKNNIITYNTDGLGFILGLKFIYELNFKNKNILMNGAGGAVRGLLPSLISQNPKNIFIQNRTESKIIKLKKEFNFIKKYDKSENKSESIDIIINAVSFNNQDFKSTFKSVFNFNFDFKKDLICIDLNYLNYRGLNNSKNNKTPFCEWAGQNGLKNIDGLAMLIGQAVLNVEIVLGREFGMEQRQGMILGVFEKIVGGRYS